MGGVPKRRVVGLGHPRLDQYFVDSPYDFIPESIVAGGVGKFKVVYAPHHSLDGWSTFFRNAESIRRFARENEDVFLVVRPHPILLTVLRAAGKMSEREFREFFSGERCAVHEADSYHNLFRWSDALVSDGSSFLIEYAPTRKPIVYLLREDGWGGLDETLHDDVCSSYYVARNESEIGATLRLLKSGVDPLRERRIACQAKMSVGIFEGGAGRRIAEYLKKTLA